MSLTLSITEGAKRDGEAVGQGSIHLVTVAPSVDLCHEAVSPQPRDAGGIAARCLRARLPRAQVPRVISSFVDAWRDPRALPFLLSTSTVSLGAFLLFALPLSWIAWREPAWAAPYRLQRRRARAQTLFAASLLRCLLNHGAMTLAAAVAWPLIALSHLRVDGPLPSLFELGWQVALFIYLDDFLYYWMHRAMHTRWLYKRVHSVHHRIKTPWAITGLYMHPLEYVLTGGLMILGPLLLGSHLVTALVWIVVRQLEAAEGHCGYAFPWSPLSWLPGSEGAAHHDLHHARVRVNYAGFLAVWDKVFGTWATRDGED